MACGNPAFFVAGERAQGRITPIQGHIKGGFPMAGSGCKDCSFRAKYDNNPKSILGRIWRWHAGWCPGWKGYMNSLPEDERVALAEKYDFQKYK
jgi:hypothetical protein